MSEEKINKGSPSSGTPGVSFSTEKSKNLKKAYRDLFQYIGNYKSGIIAASVLSLIAAVLNLIGPNKISDVTNIILNGINSSIDLPSIVKIGKLLAILYIAGLILNYIQGWIMATVTQKVTQNMRNDISEKVDRLPLSYFDTHSYGDILSRVTNDVDTVNQSMNQSFSTLVSSFAMLIGSAVMMLATNWIMALSGFAAAFLGMLLTTQIIKHSQKYFSEQQSTLADMNSHVEEVYNGLDIVKAYNGEEQEKKKFTSLNYGLYGAAWKSQFLSGLLQPFMIFIGNLAYVVVCIVGAILAVRGVITFGVIVAFMIYIRLFTQPLQNISQAATSVQSVGACCERIFEFLDEEEMPKEERTGKLNNVQGNVVFDHVSFGYTSEREIIHDFNCAANKGQKVAIVGPTGAGKTTLVNLLMRFYDVNAGKITIDGVSTKDISREEVHEQCSMVLQDTWLFEGSIRENLVYNQTGITDDQLNEVCKATGLTDFVRRLPNGYDTILNDQIGLSVGQRQLLTIARAMLKNAQLLILDEATSSVDTRTELQVQQAMDKLMEGRTCFVIAHRLSTIKNADLILVLNNGEVIEEGTHEELLQKNGFYAELYNSQFMPVA
jgi:ATP-binding cassette subfamily B multidrug efflux pump